MSDLPDCPKCGAMGYSPWDAINEARCCNPDCELHKVANVLSRAQWIKLANDKAANNLQSEDERWVAGE